MPLSLSSKKLSQYPSLQFALSTKQFSNLSFQHPIISEKTTIQNRKRFFSSIGISENSVINIALKHGNKIFWAEKKDRGKGAISKLSLISFCDGIACHQNNIFLMITIADCFPVFLFDPKERLIGLAHVGWRGVLNKISVEMIRTFQKRNSDPKSIIAFIGPGLQVCHLEVTSEVFKLFDSNFDKKIAFKKKNRYWLNLQLAIQKQLLESGIKKSNVESSTYCTFCEDELFSSYRRDKENYIAQGAIIGMKN